MVNEITVNMFILLFIIDFIFILIAFLLPFKKDISSLQNVIKITFTVFAAFLSFILANMILNGNVNEIVATIDQTKYIPIRSQPLNYIFLGFGVIMSFTSAIFVFQLINNYITTTKEFSALGDWKKI